MFKLAALVFFTGTMAYSCFATEISESFTAVTDQVAGKGSGFFNVAGNSPVYGTLTFNPADFTPNPVMPSGSTYLAVFTGAADSVKMTVSDAGGRLSLDAQSSFLELSPWSSAPWALVTGSGQFSFSLIVQSAQPIAFPPGSSVFDLADLPGSTISVLLSSPSNSVGFDLSSVSVAPEPSSMLLVPAGVSSLLLYRRGRKSAPSV